jgi:cytochrome P450
MCHVMFERSAEGTATEAAFAAGHGIRDYFRALRTDRLARPRDDVMSHVTHAEIEGVGLTEDEVVGMAIFLYAAGNETTSMLIVNALWLLDRFPRKRDQLRADAAAIPGAIEEILRYEARTRRG